MKNKNLIQILFNYSKILILSTFFISLFSMCGEEDEDPITLSPNYITNCSKAEYNITFSGTNFFNEDDGTWGSFDQIWNYCYKYLDSNTVNWNNPNSIDFEPDNLSYYELEYNPNGTQDLELGFVDKGDPYIGGWDKWQLEFTIEDIGSFPIGVTMSGSNSDCVSRINGNFFQNDWDLTLTSSSNGNYSGQINCYYTPDPLWLLLDPDYLPTGTNTPFTAVINFDFAP